jgi:signal peptidase I
VADGKFVETFEPQGPIRSLPQCLEGRVPQGAPCTKEKAIETLPGGTTHSVLNVYDGRFDNTGVFSVPEGNYFFVGDNRDNSTDSRERQDFGGVGYVPFDHLIGRADRVMFSSAGRSLMFVWTWRPDRFFKKIE